MINTNSTTQTQGRYKKIQKLSSGAYGSVYKALDTQMQEYVALKKLYFSEWEENGIPTLIIREIIALKELQDPNIIKLKDIQFVQNQIYLIFELMSGDLREYIDKQPNNELIPLAQVKNIMQQILKALHVCRIKGFIHRDIKPQNILYDSQDNFKLTDFGISRLAQIEKRKYTPTKVVSLWYRPPEILLGFQTYTHAIDMWSLGCVFFEIVTKLHLFKGVSELDQLDKIFKILGTPDANIWPDIAQIEGIANLPQYKQSSLYEDLQTSFPNINSAGIDLMKKMLDYNPEIRISPKDALAHPFFSSN